MRSKKIYLVRHGETSYNKLGMVQGSGIDASLNEVGRQQALAFYKAYSLINFDKIYTSQLRRTHQSVQGFIDTGIPWQKLNGLNEVSWGDREGRLITREDDVEYFSIIDAWVSGDYTRKVPGGESPLEVAARQRVAMDYIMSNDHEQTILICMHGRAMRILLCLLLDEPLLKMETYNHTNLCLYVLNYADGKFALERANDCAHLEEISALGSTAT